MLSITKSLKKHSLQTESEKIIEALEVIGIDNNRIIGLVFDTTSVNTGVINGIVVRLQTYFLEKLLN